jgi:hypothetical protein
MATAPYLVREDDELLLDVAVGPAGRRRLALSDRATALLVDDLEYGDHDVLPWLTARTLVLARGVYSREGKTDARDLSWSITGAEGGADATEEEVRRLAEFLRSVEIDPQAVETMKEHVRESRLSAYIDPEAVRSTRDRTRGLRDIARDL